MGAFIIVMAAMRQRVTVIYGFVAFAHKKLALRIVGVRCMDEWKEQVDCSFRVCLWPFFFFFALTAENR